MRFAYWIAQCRTSGCHAHHIAKVIGRYEEGVKQYSLPVGVPEFVDFECSTCGNIHRYTARDLHVMIFPFLPSPGFPEWW